MQQFFKEHSGGFHTVDPQKIWNKYTKDVSAFISITELQVYEAK